MLRHYRILDLPPGASVSDVKKAYRKKALQYHPDRNNSAGARLKFQEISEAYNQLLVPPKVREPKISPEEMAEQLARRLKDQKRERMKAYMKKRREKEHEALINSRMYKIAVRFQRMVAYMTLGVALSMIIIPLVTLLMEYGAPDFKMKRGIFLMMVTSVGPLFLFGGIYMVKKKKG